MSQWSAYPFLRITIFFGLGILAYPILTFNILYIAIGNLLMLLIFINAWYRSKYPKSKSILNGLLILTVCFIMGVMRMHLIDPSKDAGHLVNSKLNEGQEYLMTIDSYPVEKENYMLYEAQVMASLHNGYDSISGHHVNMEPVHGRMNLYIKKDLLLGNKLIYGDVLVINKRPLMINGPTNPHGFDYQDYMRKKRVLHQVFVNGNDFDLLGNQPRSLVLKNAYQIRDHLKNTLEGAIESAQAKGISLALILGIKDGLDRDLKDAYSAAGAMHILAVSGLHVGIIYIICEFVLGFMKRWRYGVVVFLLSSLLILWGYAFITGLSPSVLRAVIMFSVFLIGSNLKRSHNIYNSLAASAFFVLIYDPYMLWQVGFQLSYMAVIGIVYVHPKLYRLFSFKYWIFDKAWSITCVSIAAQLATFPIGFYYFHQFPTYFLISNLMVIPAAYLILISGLGILLASILNETLTDLLGQLLNLTINSLNASILFFERLPLHKIERISIDTYQLVIIYAIIICSVFVLVKKNAFFLKIAYALCTLFVAVSIVDVLNVYAKKEIVFYQMKGHGAIDFIKKGTVSSHFGDTILPLNELNYQMDPNRLANYLPTAKGKNVKRQKFLPLKNIGKLLIWEGNEMIILTEDLSKYKTTRKIKSDFLILSNAVSIDVNQLLDLFEFENLIIDSTYKPYQAKRISKKLDEREIIHWNIPRDGAFIYSKKCPNLFEDWFSSIIN